MPPDRHRAVPEGWDFDERRRPARSVLPRVAPMGIGTPEVEALSSLTKRLAVELDLPASHLAVHALAPALGRAQPVGGTSPEWGRYFSAAFRLGSGSMNGVGRRALTWSAALAELMACPEVAHTTLAAWHGVLPAQGLMRPSRAVCPVCLEEQRTADGVVRELLAWQIAAVETCGRHDVLLETTCRACGAPSPVVGTWSVAGRCAACGAWSGGGGNRPAGDLAWQRFVAREVGALVAATAGLETAPTGDAVSANVNAALAATGLTTSALADALGVSVGLVSLWCADRRRPTLAGSLRLCRLTGWRLVDFLTVPQRSPIEHPCPAPPRFPPRRRIDWPLVETALQDALALDAPPSLTSVLAVLGVDPRQARERLPRLSAAIRDKHARTRAAAITAHRVQTEAATGRRPRPSTPVASTPGGNASRSCCRRGSASGTKPRATSGRTSCDGTGCCSRRRTGRAVVRDPNTAPGAAAQLRRVQDAAEAGHQHPVRITTPFRRSLDPRDRDRPANGRGSYLGVGTLF